MFVKNELSKFRKETTNIYRVMPYFVKFATANKARYQTLPANNSKHMFFELMCSFGPFFLINLDKT